MPEQLSLLDSPAMPSPSQTATQQLEWQVRVSRRARSIKIQVFPHGGVEVVVPQRTRPAEVQEFVTAHKAWITKTRAEFLRQRPIEAPLPTQLSLAALDEHWQVTYSQGQTARVRSTAGRLEVTSATNQPQDVWPLLRHWLKQRGRESLPRATAALGELTGLQPDRIQIRLQRTRWGSCSGTGTISLNAALLLRPPEQLRYVVVHELCHLRHLNHSRRFWALVERYVPDYRELDQRLDRAWETAPNWLIG